MDDGYESLTMQRIAARAGASKETLYVWFGSRDGLLQALIERNADESVAAVATALERPSTVATTLTGYAVGLLSLLTGPASVALNRAAMTSPALRQLLLRSGRHRIGFVVERYLHRAHEAGEVHAPDPAAAFRLLYGLIVQDTQIRVLLGEQPPTRADMTRRADDAVAQFLQLSGRGPIVDD